jgi:hypothetical protein
MATMAMTLTRRELKETCWHEAGHVVVSRLLGGEVFRVSVDPRGLADPLEGRHAGSLAPLYGAVERSPVRDVMNNIVIAFAGMEAGYTALQGRTWTADDFNENGDGDRETIVNLGRLLVAEGGDGDAILEAANRRARDLVLDHRRDVEKVARALLARGTLSAADLDALLGPMTVHDEMDHAGFAELDARVARPNRDTK